MRHLLAAMLLVIISTSGIAQSGPLDRTELDRRVVKAVYETARMGTEIFNNGKHEECFRLYQGTLLAAQPLLDHRAKLAESVKAKLEKAATMKAAEGAFVLREALDEIQYAIAPGAKITPKVEPKTEPKTTVLWDRLGGEDTVRKVVHDFLLHAIDDQKNINLLRDGKFKLDAKGVMRLEQLIIEMISSKTGGPLKYTGKDMKTAHAGMKITSDQFDATAAQFLKSLEKFKVPKADAEALMKIVEDTRADIVEVKRDEVKRD